MKNDIVFENNEYVFNYRVALIFKKGNKILVQKDKRVSHITMPGGRCNLGENSIDTAIREFKEETGIDSILKKKIGMIENFFVSSFNGKKYHEILMIYEMDFNNKELYDLEVIKNIEEHKKDNLSFIWLEVDKLKELNFKPDVILYMINSEHFEHIILNN